jgi:hypothetical protein
MNKKRARPTNHREVINEHDLTVKMLDFIRGGLITEEKNDSITIDGAELDAEIKGFEGTINITGNIEKYNPLIVYPYDGNVEWGGTFFNGLEWTYSLRNGTNIKGDVKVDDNELELMSKIKKYGEIWANEWAKKLRTDYKVQSNDSRAQQ